MQSSYGTLWQFQVVQNILSGYFCVIWLYAWLFYYLFS